MNLQGELFQAAAYGPTREMQGIEHDFEGISHARLKVGDGIYRLAFYTADMAGLDEIDEAMRQLVDWPVEKMNPRILYGLIVDVEFN